MAGQSDGGANAVPAGTIIVLDAARHTVLLLRRRETLRFMGGFWVFPGGAVDLEDAGTTSEGDATVGAAARAACRELREEAGLEIAADRLVHWGHWITPSRATRRFDTHFFLALCPLRQSAWLASAESVELRWADPEWVANAPPDFPVTAPTQVELLSLVHALREAGSATALLGAARTRPIRTVVPKLSAGAAVMPWDPEYGALPGTGVDWDAVARAERAGWPSRWPAVVPTAQ